MTRGIYVGPDDIRPNKNREDLKNVSLNNEDVIDSLEQSIKILQEVLAIEDSVPIAKKLLTVKSTLENTLNFMNK